MSGNITRRRGRPAKKYDQREIENIVAKFKKEEAIIGLVSYSAVYRYALSLYEAGLIEHKFSEDFWRKPNRQGTLAVDAANKVLVDDVSEGADEDIKIIDSNDAVNKLFTGKEKDKRELANKMMLNEVVAKRAIKTNENMKSRIRNLEEEVSLLKEQNRFLEKKANEMQLLLFEFMEYSKKKGFPVENLMNTGLTRSKPVNGILSFLFSDNPINGFDFERYISEKKENKVVDFEKTKQINSNGADDYGRF